MVSTYGRDSSGRLRCGTMAVHRRLLDEVPGYADARARCENDVSTWMARGRFSERGVVTVPVVVHVVWNTQAQNISRAQIDSQIDILNSDFAAANVDIGNVPAAFTDRIGNARIQFRLATRDPNGAQHSGITRTNTNRQSFSSNDDVKSNSSGGVDAWPADQYLNMWVCQLGGGLLGYAQFPGGPDATDGVVITHTAFGNTGTAAAPFDRGRTATHEIGHWLDVYHIWGDDGTGCSGSDLVNDTPNQGGPNTGCPTFPNVSCSNGPNGDMFMNFMDYVNDDCMIMFSRGQVDRMDATLEGSRSWITQTASTGSWLEPVLQMMMQ